MKKQAKDTPIGKTRPYPKNPRTRAPASVQKLADSDWNLEQLMEEIADDTDPGTLRRIASAPLMNPRT